MAQIKFSEFFIYEPDTGRLLWKVKRPGPQTKIGEEVGSIKHDGRYRSVVLFHKRYYVHRIILEILNGHIPTDMCVDHIDGNGLNNKIENLRICTLSENQRNRRKTKTNKTGIDGVHLHRGGFSVYCASKYIKHTMDFFEACCIRKSSEIIHGYNPNNSRN